LIKWNTFCIKSTKSKILTATFKAEGNRLELELADVKYERDNNSYLDIIDGSGEFRFNPITLNSLLNVLPSEQIHFYPSKRRLDSGQLDRYYITDSAKTFMSAIMLYDNQ
jgi:hypothetical protein